VVLNVSNERPEDVIRKFLENASKGVKVTVVSSYDVRSVITAGILGRALRALDIEFEILGEESKEAIESNAILINCQVGSCSNCVMVFESKSEYVSKRGSTYILKLTSLPESFRRILAEYVIIPKEIRYLVLASILSKYTPRLMFKGLDNNDLKVFDEALKDGIIESVPGLKLMGWSIAPITNILKCSVDVLITKFFMSDEIEKEREVKLSPNDIASLLELKSSDELLSNNYIIKDNWVVKDLYQLTYSLIYGLDIMGIDLSTLVMNTNKVTWLVREFMESLINIKELLNLVLSGKFTKYGKYYIIEHGVNIEKTSITILNKVLKGMKLISNEEAIIVKLDGNLLVPLQLANGKIINKAVGIKHGYAVIKNIKDLP